MTLPSASCTEAISLPPPTSLISCCACAPASRSACTQEPLGAHLPAPIVSRDDGGDPKQEALLADSVGLTLDAPERFALGFLVTGGGIY